jgi:hypothetical protein
MPSDSVGPAGSIYAGSPGLFNCLAEVLPASNPLLHGDRVSAGAPAQISNYRVAQYDAPGPSYVIDGVDYWWRQSWNPPNGPPPSSSANPLYNTVLIHVPDHPDHPAISPRPGGAFTLLPNPDGVTYQITFNNFHIARTVRVFLKAFVTDPNSPTWSDMSLVLPSNNQYPWIKALTFPKASLSGARTIWLGAWWDDGTYATTAAYFADHPTGGGHHTQPITSG